MQSERHEDIAEALSLLKESNPLWQPKYFMTDYSEAEMPAIEQVFPDSWIFLCDFHREQAWQRWMRDSKHELSEEGASVLFDHLRRLAYVEPCREPGQTADKHYREAEKKLKECGVWKNNAAVRNWLTAKWLSIPQKWARAWTECNYHLNIHTNNGVESQNKVLKYSFLPRGKKLTLTEVFSIIIDRYLPSQKQSFVFANISQTSQFRLYKDNVPDFLHDRPRKVIIHCQQRELHSREYCADDIAADGEGKFEVSSAGRQLSVDFTVPSCSCEDWCLHGYPRKHFFAIFRLVPGWDWSALPAAYTASPRMVASAEILAEGFTTPLQEPAIQLEENIPETADELPARESSTHEGIRRTRRIRNKLKVLENQSYIAGTDMVFLDYLEKELDRLSAEFSRVLPADTASGLVAPPASAYSLADQVRAKRKYAEDQGPPKRDPALDVALPKRSRQSIVSKLRCRVGVSGDTERKLLTQDQMRKEAKDRPAFTQLLQATKTQRKAPRTATPHTKSEESTPTSRPIDRLNGPPPPPPPPPRVAGEDSTTEPPMLALQWNFHINKTF